MLQLIAASLIASSTQYPCKHIQFTPNPKIYFCDGIKTQGEPPNLVAPEIHESQAEINPQSKPKVSGGPHGDSGQPDLEVDLRGVELIEPWTEELK